MKFKLSRTSGRNEITRELPVLSEGRWSTSWEIEINTLEELLELQKEVNNSLIIDDDNIEIYDDYRE